MRESELIWKGIPVSPGVTHAKTYHYKASNVVIEEGYFEPAKVQDKLKLFHDTFSEAIIELHDLYELFAKKDKKNADIFAVHIQIIEGSSIQQKVLQAIEQEYMQVDYAIATVFDAYIDKFSKIQDELVSTRANDLHDLKIRLLSICNKQQTHELSNLTEDVIVVADTIYPSDIATLDKTHVKGIITQTGGAFSHAAMLARSLSLPAIFGIENVMETLPDGQRLYMDGEKGIASLNEEDVLGAQQTPACKHEQESTYIEKETILKDGKRVQIGINIDALEQVDAGLPYDYVGLFRTEFIYMQNDHLPTEEEQFVVYRKALECANGKIVTLRTLDVGGDKIPPYLTWKKELNPVLGERGIRFCFAHEELFLTQLKAMLRASVYGQLWIMFPMVTSLEDIQKAKSYVRQAMEILDREQIPYDKDIKLGIMIEVPAIAMLADVVADEVDFASVGTNDLSQYLSASDRMNEKVAEYCAYQTPAMIRILHFIAQAFEEKAKPLSVCGEMAMDKEGAVILAGLGIYNLSVDTRSVLRVKETLAQYTQGEAMELASQYEEVLTWRKEKFDI